MISDDVPSNQPTGDVPPPSRPVIHVDHEHRSVSGGLARASVFGVSDGLVSNISLVIGFAGSGVGPSVVRLAGLAGLVGGAFSMAAGEYVSVAAQNELIERELEVERREIRHNSASELAELAAIYEAKGVDPRLAQEVAEDIMKRPEEALLVHAREELGVDPDDLASPLMTAVFSFLAFAAGAILPVIPWFFAQGMSAAVASVVLGVIAAALVGSFIGRLAERHVAKAAARQVLFLAMACSATYLVGSLLGVSVS
ncbi:MAG: VIT1/CCC1 transporter family protein [Ilumatobacteraceae bacterium]